MSALKEQDPGLGERWETTQRLVSDLRKEDKGDVPHVKTQGSEFT